jgi:hypothetical protein
MKTDGATHTVFFGRRTGAPFAAGDVEITPESLVLLVHWRQWGYVWNWPVAVSVTRSGRRQRHAIVDATRLALWSLRLAALVMALGFLFLPANRPSKQGEGQA